MKINNFLKKNFLYLYLILLVIFSFFFNLHYSYIGVLPVDSFSTFNSGYDILNGSLPFKDFWTIKGPVLDIIQAFIFKLFGISWFSYAAHSSIFNSIFALATFFTLKKFDLEIKYCFFYSILASVLMYPTYGIPFTDHHVAIFSMLSIYCLCLAIKFKDLGYWYLVPVFLFLGFFSKQTPAAYFGILITVISLLYLIKNFQLKIIFNVILISFILILILIFLLYFFEVPFKLFLVQYFWYPMSLGETRLEWLLPIEFKRFVLRHKLLYISLSIPLFLFVKNLFKNFSSILSRDSLIHLLLFGTLIIFVTHQLMTINGLFIFFLIPVFCGFSHVYSNSFKIKKKLISFFLVLSFVSTIYYHQKYISKRDTLILRNSDLNISVDASILDKKLKNLKWLTHHYPDNPKKEISNLQESIKIIKDDSSKKMIVTDYQFISVILGINDNAASRIWWRHHIYPSSPEKPYFKEWKSFLINKIKEAEIKTIYTIHPLEGEKNIFQDLISAECYIEKKINEILTKQEIKICTDLRFQVKS